MLRTVLQSFSKDERLPEKIIVSTIAAKQEISSIKALLFFISMYLAVMIAALGGLLKVLVKLQLFIQLPVQKNAEINGED